MTPAQARCQDMPLPTSVSDLSWNQALGRACVACNENLTAGAVSRGTVRGQQGAHRLDVEVWACPALKVVR